MAKRNSLTTAVLFTLFPLLANPLTGEQVKGRITDSVTRQPLPMAFVMIEGQESGATVSQSGEFTLPLPKGTQRVVLLAFCEGYEDGRCEALSDRYIEIRLEKQMSIHETITVTAQSGLGDQQKQAATLKKMDVYTIPGTAGDPLLTATILPGVNAPADSSDLLIRGGAPDEVAYFYDGMEVLHPFLSESSQASYFSIFDNQFIDRFNIINSGFDSKFGNALSGIIDLQPHEEARAKSNGVGLSIMGGQVFYNQRLGEKAGLLVSGKYNFNEWLDRVNGRRSSVFQNANSMGSFYWKTGEFSRLKLTWLADIYRLSDVPELKLHSANQLLGLSYSTVIGKRIYTRLTAAAGHYQNEMRFDSGSFGKTFTDFTPQFRLDNIYSTSRHEFNFGLDILQRDEKVTMTTIPGDAKASGRRFGIYAGDKIRLNRVLSIHPTLRANLLHIAGRDIASIDPALSLALNLSDSQTLRASLGQYHQFGDYFSYALQPSLKPKNAVHLSLTYDYVTETLKFRVSIYSKEYRRLFLNEGLSNNSGRGFARGAEFYIKKTGRHIDFILVYNYLHSQRREGDITKLVASSYEIPHALTAVISYKARNTQVGFRASYADGRPYTPLLEALPLPDKHIYQAIYGEPNSLRLPPYKRLDLNLSHRLHIKGRLLVLYLGIMNLLDRTNIQFCQFNPKDGKLEFIRSLFHRCFFIGIYYPF